MTEAQLRSTYEAEKPALLAWGKFIVKSVIEKLEAKLGPDRPVRYFLKLWPVEPRLKDTKSLVAKAFWRGGKKYENPLSDITDKMGARFVVLLLDDIRIVESVIQGDDRWHAECARDFEEERAAKPLYFDYQSLHYVVRAKCSFEHLSVLVPESTPCEIQIRTLLQHAYSELTHDTIYKPKSALEAEKTDLLRKVARSMALIESSDELFQTVADAIRQAESDLLTVLERAAKVFRSHLGEPKHADFRLVEFILSPFRSSLPLISEKDLNELFESRPYLAEFFRSHAVDSALYETPLILIVLRLIIDDEDRVWRNWPIDRKVIEEIFSVFGLSTERY